MAGSGYCVLLLLGVVLTETLGYGVNMAQENLKRLSTANNDMALNIHRQLADKTTDNVFFSPLSLSSAFGMLYYGTRGNTAQELRKVLGYDRAGLRDDLVHQAFQTYLTESLQSQDPSAYVLNAANAALLDKRLRLDPSYKSDVQNLYQATVQDVDFVREAPRIVSEINSWIRDKTNGKIDKLLDKLDPSTALVLLNAVYFKGTWKTQFEPRKTRPQTFYNNGVSYGAKEVPMMRMTESFSYASLDDIQVVELPYKGENVSMVILLPKERNGLRSLENSLTLEKISTIRQQLYKTKVHLTIPKFKIEYSREMSEEFQTLGARSVFTPGGDFSGISPDRNIYVTQVLHKAVVEVNEEGSEAAAVTGIVSNRMRPMIDPTPEFTLNHPFMFVIKDQRTNMILFMGRVTNL